MRVEKSVWYQWKYNNWISSDTVFIDKTFLMLSKSRMMEAKRKFQEKALQIL